MACGVAPQTILAYLLAAVRERGLEPALGVIRAGQIEWRTWSELMGDVARQVSQIRVACVQPGDRVAQVSENRYEWIIADLALHLAGAVHVPIHVTLSGEQIAEQIAASGARLVFVSRVELLTTFDGRLSGNVPVLVHDEQAGGQYEALLGRPAVAPVRSRKRVLSFLSPAAPTAFAAPDCCLDRARSAA